MGDGIGGFLREVRDAAVVVPIVGGWIQNIGPHDGQSESSKALEKYFFQPGSQPIVEAMHGLNWFADNAINQPLSTAILMGSRAREESVSHLISASDWGKAWHAANNISPGQAFMARGQEQAARWGATDIGPSSARELINAKPIYASPQAAYLPPGWDQLPEDQQQTLLKDAGMPVVGNSAVEQLRRDSAFFKYSSGAADLLARWYLDPTVLAGRAAGLARSKYVVTPRPRGGWSGEDIDSLMSSSRMAKVQKFMWENKDNPQLINNLDMFKKSALGPRAGGIVSKLKSPEEVALFTRTILGDVDARAQLQSANTSAATRMEQDTSRLSNLELGIMPRVQAMASPNLEALVTRRADELRNRIAADEDLAARYKGALDHYAELDALNLTRFSPSRAYTRTSNQRLYRTGPAIGTVAVPRAEGEAGSTAAKASGLAKGRIYADDLFGQSFTVVRSFGEKRPNGLIAVDDLHQEAVDELRGHLARIPGIGSNIRADLLNRYLKTTSEGDRVDLLDEIQHLGVTKVAEKHGFTYAEGKSLYGEYMANIAKGKDTLRRYSGANFGEEGITADEFLDYGGILKVHPNMVTKLINDQVLIDLPALDKTLARNASTLKALRTNPLGNTDWMLNGLDGLNSLWKFATLFRLGYIPRVLGDDVFGQVVRVGAGAMALRTGYGVKNLATNLFHWKAASHYEGAEAVAKEGVKYADNELATLQPQADALRQKIAQREAVHKADWSKANGRLTRAQKMLEDANTANLGATDPAKLGAIRGLVQVRAVQAQKAKRLLEGHSPTSKDRLGQLDDQLAELSSHRDLSVTAAQAAREARKRGFRQSSQLYKNVEVAPGVVLPPALGGERGEYYMKLTGSDDSLRTLTQGNKQMIHSNLQKAYGSKAAAPISYAVDPDMYVGAWNKAINHQIMQDAFAVQAVKGASVEDMTHWLTSTPAGRAYRTRLGIEYDTPERIAQSVWHEVDEYMPAGSGIREAALKGEADPEYLAEMAKNGIRPQYVHNTNLGEALAGSNDASRAIDRVKDWWYKWAASVPADRMSRHPLFNQLYEGHARSLVGQELKQGERVTQADADRIAETARRLALKDTRKLVFDIAHRSDFAAMTRFMSPFFAATSEAWQRWARIIADRPQTVGYASMFFNAPASWGWMQDQDGNKIERDGTAWTIDPKTGKAVQRLVPKNERMIIARVPKFLVKSDIGKALGLDSVDNQLKQWKISQDSLNLVTQGDPWFNPGTGPVVSIPASLLVKDKPKQAELLRQLGVLPFGPTPGGLGQTFVQQSSPAYLRNFFTSFDTSDERYQRVKLQIMQQAAYEHANLGKPMPSAQEIADRTRNYWLFSAFTAFTQPFATQHASDQYQFFRDQYNALRRKDPLTADEEYLKRFGESHFIFAQATSDNVGGIPATMKAVELEKKYGDLIAKNPDLAALVVGPEGNGPFSPEAYAYQLTTPLIPGGAEMQRTKLSADEAMQENQRRLGWAKYTGLMNTVTAQLHSAGYNSFEDQGAEQFKKMRSAVAKLYGDPLLPDGSNNPYYNEQWSKDYYSLDPKRYDRMIPGLTAVAFSDLANQDKRSDLKVLQQYLTYRRVVTQELAARKQVGGSLVLSAKSNADLAAGWAHVVDALVESNTSFGDLFHRYLARDMGVDVTDLASAGVA